MPGRGRERHLFRISLIASIPRPWANSSLARSSVPRRDVPARHEASREIIDDLFRYLKAEPGDHPEILDRLDLA